MIAFISDDATLTHFLYIDTARQIIVRCDSMMDFVLTYYDLAEIFELQLFKENK